MIQGQRLPWINPLSQVGLELWLKLTLNSRIQGNYAGGDLLMPLGLEIMIILSADFDV